jgi:hypothetical protein
MALPVDPANIYTIIVPSVFNNIPVGAVCYRQVGVTGTPIGLLLSLTNTPLYKKVIQTVNGFQGVD